MANDDGRLSEIVGEEGAGVDSEAENLLDVGGGADDLGGIDGEIAGGGVDRDGEGGDTGDVFILFNGI